MNVLHAILIKLVSVLLFAVMSVLVRWLGDRVPTPTRSPARGR